MMGSAGGLISGVILWPQAVCMCVRVHVYVCVCMCACAPPLQLAHRLPLRALSYIWVLLIMLPSASNMDLDVKSG